MSIIGAMPPHSRQIRTSSLGSWSYKKEKQDRFILTRQCVLDGLLENIEKALGRRPVKIGEEGKLVYVYRGDVANNALKLAGNELGLFVEKAEVTHKREFDELSDLQIVEEIQREAQLLLEHHSREMAEKSIEDVVVREQLPSH